MTWNLNLLNNVIDIVPCSIGLPDGDCALAVKQGDIFLGGDMWLVDRGLICTKFKVFLNICGQIA